MRLCFYELAQDRGEPGLCSRDDRFASLVEEIEVEGQKLAGLTAMGQLFHETFRYRFTLQSSLMLPPDAGLAPEGKKVRYEKSQPGRPPGIEEWFALLKEVPFVKQIYTHYYNPDLPLNNYYRYSSRPEISQIEGGYSDGKATTKFDLITTATTFTQRAAALVYLQEQFLAK